MRDKRAEVEDGRRRGDELVSSGPDRLMDEDLEGPDAGPPSARKTKVFPLSALPVCTVPPGPITVPENNTADVQLVQISSGSEVTLTLTVNPENFFYLKGNALVVKKGLDYEVSRKSQEFG